MSRFEDQVVVVTGATSGIGRATARAFTAGGARVVGTGRDQGRLAELSREVDLALTLDVTRARDVDLLRSVVQDRYGQVDVLVNNAGIGLFRDWERTSIEDFQRLLEVDLLGVVRVTSALLPLMVERGSGSLVQVASVAGKRGFERQVAYCAAKHGLVGYSEALRQELTGSGVRVCVICPPAVRTPFFARAGWPEMERDLPHLRPMTAEAVAVGILAAVHRGERQSILSPRAKALHAASRLAPGLLDMARERWARPRE